MSVICVVTKNEQVCIAADTLTRFGSTKESAKYIKEGGKLIRHGNAVIGVVGHASIDLILQLFLEENEFQFDSRRSIFQMMLAFHTHLKDNCFLNTSSDDLPFETSHAHLLIATPTGIFGAYDLRSVQEYNRFYAFGSGDDVALGAMYAIYDGDASAEKIAEMGVLAACEFDDGCGLPIEIEVIGM